MLVYMIVVVIVLAIVLVFSFGIAALLAFGGIPLIYVVRKIPKEKRRIGCLFRGVLTIVVGTLLTGILMVWFIRRLTTSSSNQRWQRLS